MAKKVTVIPAKQLLANSTKKMPEQKKIRVAAYCRVSTDQDEQLNSFENQVEYYTRYINENPMYEMVDIYADEGISGTNVKKRKEFQRLIADCEAGKIDLVLVNSSIYTPENKGFDYVDSFVVHDEVQLKNKPKFR